MPAGEQIADTYGLIALPASSLRSFVPCRALRERAPVPPASFVLNLMRDCAGYHQLITM